ncbi:hypothetical protein BFP72_01485 [Reichenbachiella sp. 5M10]|uniref:VWA domain-containing protein n=1 Tax=Reichenbachiella sp. 5M10 TaxID=1889772 RepID=UPI000C153CB2|nr:VWA domain-containing protein [Reichenbachiella sp. 5M10]PIB34194.1 hypothetical protein BFP72_01485 [Reichenbachiella sp. 5M10]
MIENSSDSNAKNVALLPIIQFEYSVWLLPLYLLIACAISYLLYSKKTPWNSVTNKLLFVLRVMIFTSLGILLLNPLFNQYIEQVEKPQVVLVVDHSTSMLNHTDSLQVRTIHQTVSDLEETLEGKGYDVLKSNLDQELETWTQLEFSGQTTDLSAALQRIAARYENANLAAMYLVSDGKYNRGQSPVYQSYPFVMHTIGVGDTTQKYDLAIRNVLFNKIAYQGNRFPIVAEVYNFGFLDEKTTLRLTKKGKTIASKQLVFDREEGLVKVEFEVEAKDQGLQRLDVVIDGFEEESIQTNNRQSIYVDVIDGKQSVLLVAPAPHPDLKTLREVIEKNKNFEVKLFVPGLSEMPIEKVDLAIVHNAFDSRRRTQKVVNELIEQKVPMFYVLGFQTNFNALPLGPSELAIAQRRNQKDLVTAQLNPDMDLFIVTSDLNERWQEFVPVLAPYGEITIPADAKVLLHQRVGAVTTQRPLLYTTLHSDVKHAYLLADGIWQWRLQEYASYENTDSFDEFFLKLVQYLSTKVDKRKFKFYPVRNEYGTNQIVEFQSELYNEIYERVYGEELQVRIMSENGLSKEYAFVPSSEYSLLKVANLEAGKYQYEAIWTEKKDRVNGDFIVRDEQLEQFDQVADFGLMRALAEANDGVFYTLSDQAKLYRDVEDFAFKGRVHFEEDVYPAINLWWCWVLVLTLASTEWFARKYSGGY